MTLKIQPLGDSITDGYTVPGGYRIDLWNRFKASNLDIDFVGSLSNGPTSLNDKDHEGHSGWRIDQITNSVNGWLNAQQPDIITLMIGTNDMIQSFNVSNAPARLSALIDQITNLLPNANLLVASIPPLSNATANQRALAFNSTIPDIVSAKVAQAKKVTFVDMFSRVTLSDLPDGVHPNQVGYNKIAQAWESAIFSVTNEADAPTPMIDYLSDLTWTSAASGWGPIEKDKSNGEQKAGDGQVMKLNGTSYSNGLGVHSLSEVHYILGGNYTTFSSDIGVDDEVGGNGTVTFQVWADGSLLYDSGLMNGNTPTNILNIDVTGKQELNLIVTDGDDNFSYDHADWANARLIRAANVGTASNDLLTGNAATNVFVGSDGNDTLTGAGGADIFSYRGPTEGSDVITDFSLDDSFYISASIFGGGLGTGISLQNTAAATGVFVSGTTPSPLGSSANILYNTNTGILSFDPDGTGLSEPLAIATLTGLPHLDTSQFTIVA